jgi:hypothetical protein
VGHCSSTTHYYAIEAQSSNTLLPETVQYEGRQKLLLQRKSLIITTSDIGSNLGYAF